MNLEPFLSVRLCGDGESAADVFDRVSTFLDSLWRSFYLNGARNYVIITQGIAIRVVLARYFRYTIDQFSMMANPKNCEMVVLSHDGAGRLQLQGRWEQEVTEKGGEKHVTGSAFHQCLCVLPTEWVRTTKIRISCDDSLDVASIVKNKLVESE
jgi:Histidine phosphatase superfamily (branch 1)